VVFVLEKDVNVAAQEVENKVQTVIPNLPETADQPTVQKLDTDAAPVLRISVSAPLPLREVTQVAKDQVKKKIDSVNGVGQITIIGGQERQINVWVDPDKLRSYSITPGEGAAALKVQNANFRAAANEGKGNQPPDDGQDPETRGIQRCRSRITRHQVKVKDLGYTEDGGEEIRSEAVEWSTRGDPDRFEAVGTKYRCGCARDQSSAERDRTDAAEGIPDADHW
jgi:HAE1 family hydrophobic/amphiphilic exporter-1